MLWLFLVYLCIFIIMGKVYIYGLVDPVNGVIKYIGKTNNPKRRVKEHNRLCNLKPNTKKNIWIKNILDKGLKTSIVIVEVTDELKWKERERYWIKYYREITKDLTNTSDGGCGVGGIVRSKNFKKNLSEKRKGSKNPFYGKKHSKETIEIISKYSKNRTKTSISVIDKEDNILFSGARKHIEKWCKDKGICSVSNMKNHLKSGNPFYPKYVMKAYPNCKDYEGIRFVRN